MIYFMIYKCIVIIFQYVVATKCTFGIIKLRLNFEIKSCFYLIILIKILII